MTDFQKKRIVSKLLLEKKIFWMLLKIFRKDCERLQVKSLYDYCDANGKIVKMVDDRSYRTCRKAIQTKEEYESLSQYYTVSRHVSKSYIAEVNDVYIRSRMDGVVKDGQYFTDRVEWDADGMCLYPPNTVIAMTQKECIIYDKKEPTKIDKGIFMLNVYSKNIFHFTFEVIGRMEEIDKIDEYDNWPFLIDSIVQKDLRTIQMIEKMNQKNRPIIWIRSEEAFEVGRLVIPPCLAWGPMDVKVRRDEKYGWIVDSQMTKYIKKKILEGYTPKKLYDKVYIARGSNNRLINEDKVIEYLESSGFEVYNPDEGDFWDEVDCFSTANCIVGCTGAAFTNIVYSKLECKIVKICPFEFQSESGLPLIDAVGFQHKQMISAQIVKDGESVNQVQFYLPIEECKRIVDFAATH